MFRKFVATALFIAFVAMATSGLMMFFIEKPSFTIQMHPVHKLFGLLMVASALAHIWLNWRSLATYLKARSVTIIGGVLVAVLVLLYGVAINNPLPQELATKLDALAQEAEALH